MRIRIPLVLERVVVEVTIASVTIQVGHVLVAVIHGDRAALLSISETIRATTPIREVEFYLRL